MYVPLILIGVAVLVMVVCLTRPIISYYLLIAILPFEGIQISSANLTPARLLGLFAIGIWILDISNRRERLSNSMLRDPVSSLMLVFFLLVVFSMIRTGVSDASVSLFGNYVSYFVLILLTLYYLREEQHIIWLLAVFSGSFALMTVLSAAEHNGLYAISKFLPLRNDLRLGSSRFVGYMRSPNYYAFLGLFAAAGAIYLVSISREKGARKFWTAVLGIVISGILASYSRAGLISLVVLIFVYMLASRKKRGLVMLLAIAAIISLPILVYVGSSKLNPYDLDQAARRYSVEYSMEDSSTQARREIFELVFQQYLRSPVLGVGLGALSKERTSSGYGATNAHNVYLSIAAQFGTVGVILFAAMFFQIIRRHLLLAKRFAVERDRNSQSANSIYLAMTTAMLVFGVAHDIGVTKWFYLAIALSPVLYRLHTKTFREQRVVAAQ